MTKYKAQNCFYPTQQAYGQDLPPLRMRFLPVLPLQQMSDEKWIAFAGKHKMEAAKINLDWPDPDICPDCGAYLDHGERCADCYRNPSNDFDKEEGKHA